MSSFETLLSSSGVLLFGRVLLDVELKNINYDSEIANRKDVPPRRGAHRLLQSQLAAEGAQFARIYGFAYEGCYYDLARPVVYLVHGEGMSPEAVTSGSETSDKPPGSVDGIGVAIEGGDFATDIRVWAYDKADVTVRMEVDTGALEDLLLGAELGDDASFVSGANVRGANVRGANVRGANVRGANVRGANVRGANVRGANVRGSD